MRFRSIGKFLPLIFSVLLNSLRSNITCYAHENQTKYSSLEHIDRTKSIFFTYKNEFVLKTLGPARQLEERFIEIRFIFTKGERVWF